VTERPLPDARARESIESDLDTTFLAEAGAGSGKTTSLVKRMVALIARGKATPEKLAAVTFTRKAAAQLRQRFQISLEEAARIADPSAAAQLGAARDNLDRCRIGTIHAFCVSLLLERPIEAGLDPTRLEVEQQEAEHLSARVFTEWIESRLAAEDATLTRLLSLGVRVDDLECSFRTLLEFPDVEPEVGPERSRPDLSKAREALRDFLDFAAEALPDEKPAAEDDFQEKVRRALRTRELPEFETACRASSPSSRRGPARRRGNGGPRRREREWPTRRTASAKRSPSRSSSNGASSCTRSRSAFSIRRSRRPFAPDASRAFSPTKTSCFSRAISSATGLWFDGISGSVFHTSSWTSSRTPIPSRPSSCFS
jgi:hypothetical protein